MLFAAVHESAVGTFVECFGARRVGLLMGDRPDAARGLAPAAISVRG